MIRTWYRDQRDIVDNAAALIGSAAATSGLGFAFWWVAARLFPPDVVGLASAAVSAMLLLSTMGILGLDALVISEIPRAREGTGRLLVTVVLGALVASALLGLGFALVAPATSENLRSYFAGAGAVVWFALGVGVTGATYVFDRAVVGLLKGGIQFRRNLWFAITKLVALPAVLLVVPAVGRADHAIYALWALTTLVSLGLVLPGTLRALPDDLRPQASLFGKLGADALRHHVLNVVQHGPGLAMPVLVVVFFPPETSAAFYVTWMLVTFAQSVPMHVSTVLHAVGVRDPGRLAQRLVATLRASFAVGAAIVVGFALLASLVLRAFGAEYADTAAGALRILALTVLPMTVKVHYFALARVAGFPLRAATVGGIAAAFELAATALAATSGSLTTMAWALLASLTVVAACLTPTLARTIRSRGASLVGARPRR